MQRGAATNARAEGLAVEAHEQQADIRIARDVAERAVHVVAVVLRIFERVGADDLDEARIARAHGAVDRLAVRCGDEKEARGLDQLAILLPELAVHAVFLESISDAAAIEPILQLAHAVVVEGGFGFHSLIPASPGGSDLVARTVSGWRRLQTDPAVGVVHSQLAADRG